MAGRGEGQQSRARSMRLTCRKALSQPLGYCPPAHQMPTVEVRDGHPERGSATCTASLPVPAAVSFLVSLSLSWKACLEPDKACGEKTL